jgi:hypothetical protein
LAVEVAVLVAIHASNVVTVVEVVCVEHLLDGLDALRQETTQSAVLSLAFLAEGPSARRTLVYHVPPLVALIADRSLRTAFAGVGERQAEEAAVLVEAGILVVAHFLAAETPHVTFEVSVLLDFFLRFLRLLRLAFHMPLPASVFHLGHEIGGLRAA